MVEPLRHRRTKGAANRYARPTAAAPHSYSTDSRRPLRAKKRPLPDGLANGSSRPSAEIPFLPKGQLSSTAGGIAQTAEWVLHPLRSRQQPHATDPPGMSAQEAASIPVNYLTAWQLMVVMGGLKPSETVLIHSAGGGVGIAATQIAKHIGASVIGTASAAKHGELRALGVDHLIDYRTEDFEARARQITGGHGVELILDAIGGDSLKKGYRLLAPTGRLGTFGVSSAATNKTGGMFGMLSMLASTPWLQFNPLSLMNANKGVFGVNLGHMWGEIDRMTGWVDQLMSLWEQGAIKPKIARTFPFDQAAAAHHFIQDRKNIGKVLLTS